MLFDSDFISGNFFSVDHNVMKAFGLLETEKSVEKDHAC
jgi:hypothetical protein